MATTENGIYYPNNYNAVADIPADLKKMAESIDKNVQDNKYDDSEIKQDIQELQSKNEEQDKKIETIETEQESQNDLLQRTQSALINITTEKSSNINVKDSSDLNAKIDVFGISEQETREGYNLLNVASTCEITGSKTVPISMPAGNYTIKADDITTDSEQTQFCFSFRDSSGTIADARISLSTKKITFALTREATSVNIYSGNSFSESQGVTTTYKNLMIYEGTEDKEYEKYGATPSPEFPSEIENVTGNIDVTICNKNLNNSEMELGGFNYLTGQLVSSTTEIRNKEPIYLNKANKITISTNINGTWGYFFYKKDKSTVISGNYKNNSNFITIEVPEEAEYIIYRFSSTDLDLPIILEIGENATDYTAHEQQTITFPLAEGQKLYKGDYPADDGIHHKRKQITITEDMLIQGIVTTHTNLDYIRIKKPTDFAGYNNPKANISLISFAKEFTDWTFDSANYINKYTCRLQYAYFMLGIEKGTTYAEIKDKLIGQTIEYELAEEEIEPYTKEQQEAYNKLQNVLSYYNVTNVFTDKALLEFKYIADTQTYVDNEINSIKNQLNTINELLSTTTTSAMLLDNMQSDLESEVL